MSTLPETTSTSSASYFPVVEEPSAADTDLYSGVYSFGDQYASQYYYQQQAYQDPAFHPDQTEHTDQQTIAGDPLSPTSPSTNAISRKSRANVDSGPFFNPTKQLCSLYSMDRTKTYGCRVNPRIDRGFFLADSDWTCYRRNYFQVSISYSAIDTEGKKIELPCLLEIEGKGLYTVTEFLVGVMARTSNGSREIDLIQHTAKRDKGPQSVPQPKTCDPQEASSYDKSEVENSNTVIFERLQFKSATANNGKRRAAQQYHVIFAELLARCDDGAIARVASTESAPLVVRGRAPGHYTSRGLKKLRKSGSKEEVNEADEEGFPEEEVPAADYEQGFQPQELEAHASTHLPTADATSHHISYNSFTAPQPGQPEPTNASYYTQVPGYPPYHHPYYQDHSVWVNAAAAANAARQQEGEGGDEPAAAYDYSYSVTGADILPIEGTDILPDIEGAVVERVPAPIVITTKESADSSALPKEN